MNLLKMLTKPVKTSVIALMASAAFGDVYVAVNDPNAGDTAIEGRGTEELPYRTLQAAMEHGGGLESGTTVWVKPGTYAEGGAEADNNSNRVVVAAGVIVRATGTAEETIIQGAPDPDKVADATLKGIGPKAVRCAYLNSGAVIRGFTLQGGRSRANDDTGGYGGCARYGTFIDCVFSNNRGRRGGALAGATAIRCLFKADNGTTYSGSQAMSGSFFNCVFLCSTGNYNVYQPNKVVNCTFYGADTENGVNNLQDDVYNTLFVGAGMETANKKLFRNTLAGTAKNSVGESPFTDGSIVMPSAVAFPINSRYAPMKSNAAIGRCTDYDAYAALFPSGFQDEAAYDFYGNPRTGDDNVFDVGAVERDDAIEENEDWYVDDANGDDDYAGDDKGLAAHPFKTIQAAMDDDRVKAFHTVHVKPGTYATGGRTEGSSSVTKSRVVMKSRVVLESTDGPAVTTIKGEAGCRCVFVRADCILRGFTLEDGQTDLSAASTGDANRYGGGVWGDKATVIGCIIRNCKAERGGGEYGSTAFIRCQFLGNTRTVLASSGVNGSFYTCLFVSGDSYALYTSGKIVNCTFTGSGTMADHNSSRRAINTLYLQGFQTINGTYENCCFGYSGAKPEASRCDDRCRFADTQDAFPLLADYAPSRRSPCCNGCTDYEAYVAEFPAAFRAEAAFDVYGRPRIGAGETTFDIGCVERDPVLDVEDWYVDPVKGDDAYAGDDLGQANHPYRTLQAAMENARLQKGNTVWALPGVYREGGCTDANSQSNRVVVPAGVNLESTGGAEVTVIEGAPEPGKKSGTGGQGPNAMRCASLKTGATLRGFTLTNGHGSNVDGDPRYGGGAKGGTLTDCVITNCFAYRNGAVYSSTLNRCLVTRCGASSIGVVGSSTLYNCLLGPQVGGSYVTLYCYTIRNCTFLPSDSMDAVHYASGHSTGYVWNSVFLGQTKNEPQYANCAFVTNGSFKVSDENMGVGSIRGVASDFKVGADGSIGAGSALIDRGDGDLYPGAAGEWDYFADRRVRGESIDLGCAEYDANPPQLTIDDPTGGLSVEGAKTGDNRIRFGEPIVFSVGRNSASVRFVRGIRVNGEFISFADHEEGWRYEGSVSAETDRVVIESVCQDEWYVDPTGGDDGNDGMTRTTAFKTFHAAFANRQIAAGDTVWALPGVYDSEIFTSSSTYFADQLTLNRLIVPEGIKVASTDGPGVTIIRGAKAPEENRCGNYKKWGLGTNSVRSVALKANSELRGFTIADGTAYSDGIGSHDYSTGGNVSADAGAYIVDCVITNGAAERGGGARGGNYVRCRFTGNIGASIGSTFVSTVNLYGCIVEKSRNAYAWYNCDGKSKVVNSIFTADNEQSSFRDTQRKLHFYNSIDLKGRGTQEGGVYHHSITVQGGERGEDTDTIVTNAAAVALNADLSPAKGSLALDAGCAEDFLTNWPSAYADEATRDLLGTPRVLNRAIDIGAVEYDWGVDFAADIARGRMRMTDASANVTETADGAVLLEGGDAVALVWKNQARKPTDRIFNFKVTEGTLTVRVDGEAVATFTADGEWKYADGAATDEIEFSFEGTGSAELLRSKADIGVLLLVR